MKIAVGAVVLCKLLISDPDTSKIITQESVNNQAGVSKNSNISSNNNFITGNNAVDAATSSTTTTTKVVTEKHYSMVVGTVEEIRSARYLQEIANTGKYKYETEEVLIVKTEELEKLIVNARSCGLAKNLIVDEKAIKQEKEIPVTPKEEKKVEQQKPKKKNIVKNKPVKANEEELEIIFLDQPIPEGYEEVKDESLTKKVSEKLGKQAANEQSIADEKYLQELLDKQQNERHVKKEQAPVPQPIVKETIIETKTEQVITTTNDDDLDVVKVLEEQKMKEKEQLEPKKAQVVKKTEVKKPMVVKKKEEPKVEQKSKITPDNFEPSGSVMKDVLDIISN